MKKPSFLTIGLFAISIGFLNAQTNQGKLILSLSSDIFGLGFTTLKTISDTNGSEEASESFNVNLSPKIGYFLIDNLAIGLDLGVGLQTGNNGTYHKYTSTSLSAGPFVRYYIPALKVLPFFELGGSVGMMNTKFINIDNTYGEDRVDKTGIINYGGGIGLAAPLGERVMVDVLAGYHSSSVKFSEDNENNERLISGILGLDIGFVILLGSM